jgi:hypothetical protein
MNMGFGLGPQMSYPNQFGNFNPNAEFPQIAQPHNFAHPQQMQPQMGQDAQVPAQAAQQPSGGMTLGAASFNLGKASEFVPKGKMVNTTEQFPDLDLLDDEPKSKKAGGKKQKKKTTVVQAKESSEMFEDYQIEPTLPWKGLKSEFFIIKQADQPLNDPLNPCNYELNDIQWKFIFKFLPEYGGAPYDMMIWLYGQAKAHEDL